MRKLAIANRMGAALRDAVVAGALVALLVASATVMSAGSAYARSTLSGPTTWHVLVGGQAADQAIQAEGYYPHAITIDAGDTVVWTLNTAEMHGVTFLGTCGDVSCLPPCLFTPGINIDVSPCGPADSNYDGVVALASSGRMVPADYPNWDNSVPHGGTTYSLTFTQPGANVYFDLSVSGMRGVVIVQPAGTPYPSTQTQYDQQAQAELSADLAAGARAMAMGSVQPGATTTNPDGTQVHHVALGASPPEEANVSLGAVNNSGAIGSASLEGIGVGASPAPSIDVMVSLSGLRPGSVHAVQILLGVCGAVAPAPGAFFSGIFVPPTFTLNPVTAGPDGRGTSTTIISQPPNPNGPGQLRIPSAGWFVNVATGATADNGATAVACGNVAFHGAAVMRDFPQTIHARVGDTVIWADNTINEIHGVTFLAGQALPLIPDWFMNGPSGNPSGYDGASFLDSGPLYAPDAGRNSSFAVTFTKAGIFTYVDVADDALLGMRGTVVVTPAG